VFCAALGLKAIRCRNILRNNALRPCYKSVQGSGTRFAVKPGNYCEALRRQRPSQRMALQRAVNIEERKKPASGAKEGKWRSL